MSRGRDRAVNTARTANHTDLQTSNVTSGHFLGTVQRDWMQHAGTNPPAVGISNSRQRVAPASVTHVRRFPTHSSTSIEPCTTTHVPTASRVQTSIPSPTAATTSSTASGSGVASAPVHNTIALTLNAIQPATQFAPVTDASNVSYAYPSPAGSESCSISNGRQPPAVPVSVPPLVHETNTTRRNWGNDGQSVTNAMADVPQQGLVSLPDSRADIVQTPTSFVPFQSASPSTNGPATSLVPTPTFPLPTIPTKRPRGRPPIYVNRTSQPGSMPLSGSAAPPALRSVASPTSMAQPLYLEVLQERFAALEARQRLGPVERIRKSWMTGACISGDFLFMLLHQLSCVQTCHPRYLMTHLGFLDSHIESLSLLSGILADNGQISPGVIKLFCEFVTPVVGVPLSPTMQAWLPHSKSFLESFGIRWSIMKRNVSARGSPPCARELSQELRADGIVLSQAIYTNFFYQLFPRPDATFTGLCFDLFKTNQDVYLARRQQGILGMIHDIPYESEVALFASKFQQLARRHNRVPSQTHHTSPVDSGRTLELNSPHIGIPFPTAQPQLQISNNGHAVINSLTPIRHSAALPVPGLTPGATSGVPSNIQTASQQVAANRLFPDAGQILPITINPIPSRVALHQVHLFDPVTKRVTAIEQSETELRFYSFVDHLIGGPKVVNKDTLFETWSIEIDPHIFGRRALDSTVSTDGGFGQRTRVLRNESLVFQLRCVEVIDEAQDINESGYSSNVTHWPEHIFISVNDDPLEFRRKTHFGKDLPVDVNRIIQQGPNELKLTYYATKRATSKIFAVFLEAVRFLDHVEVCKLPQSVDAQKSLADIIEPLQNNPQDDDVVMTDAHISIDLVDPFTARIFDTPVKGRNCRHRECFDFESFLQSRSCRNKDSIVHSDEWKCPFCGKDARPTSLVVDRFLLEVKEKLIADDKGDTKAILVKADGTWEPKTETVSATETDQQENLVESASAPAKATGVVDAKSVDIANAHKVSVHPAAEQMVVSLIDDNDD